MNSEHLKQARMKPMYLYLMILSISIAFGFQAWRTLLNNFAIEELNFSGKDIGVLQSIREIPGFLALLVVYVLLIIKEHKLAALSVILCGVGVSLTGILSTYYGFVFTTILMSTGFHYYETVNQSLTLQYFDKKSSPWVLGKIRSYSSVACIVAGGVIYLFSLYFSYAVSYALVGLPLIIAGLYTLFMNPTEKHKTVQKKSIVVKKKYWLFYALTFMAGARRQIFVAFAVFLLVQKFNFTVKQVTILFVLNNIITYFFSPVIGKMILMHGERKVLFFEYISLIFVFLGYAYSTSGLFVAFLYILDHISFNFSIAIKTYFQKIADPEDVAPSMSIGFTINHIAAVVIPTVFGILWLSSYRIPFVVGAVMALISIILVSFIPVRKSELCLSANS